MSYYAQIPLEDYKELLELRKEKEKYQRYFFIANFMMKRNKESLLGEASFKTHKVTYRNDNSGRFVLVLEDKKFFIWFDPKMSKKMDLIDFLSPKAEKVEEHFIIEKVCSELFLINPLIIDNYAG